MNKRKKVYAGSINVDGSICDVVIATTSLKRASEIAGLSYNKVKDYWGITDCPRHIEIAFSKPETPFHNSRIMSDDWKEMPIGIINTPSTT